MTDHNRTDLEAQIEALAARYLALERMTGAAVIYAARTATEPLKALHEMRDHALHRMPQGSSNPILQGADNDLERLFSKIEAVITTAPPLKP